jgi:hypothetical protein
MSYLEDAPPNANPMWAVVGRKGSENKIINGKYR